MSILAVLKLCPGLFQLGLQLHWLIVQNRKLWLQTLVLRGFHNNTLWQLSQLWAKKSGFKSEHRVLINFSHIFLMTKLSSIQWRWSHCNCNTREKMCKHLTSIFRRSTSLRASLCSLVFFSSSSRRLALSSLSSSTSLASSSIWGGQIKLDL